MLLHMQGVATSKVGRHRSHFTVWSQCTFDQRGRKAIYGMGGGFDLSHVVFGRVSRTFCLCG
jgi:hypothetical protein